MNSDFCLECKGCCRFAEKENIWIPQILNEEQNRLGINKIKTLRYLDGFICSFLKLKDNHCKVYKKRSFECRLYPFLINKKNNNLYLALDLKCPFINNRLKTEMFKEYLNYLVNFLYRPSVLNTIRANQKKFQSYPSPKILNLRRIGL